MRLKNEDKPIIISIDTYKKHKMDTTYDIHDRNINIYPFYGLSNEEKADYKVKLSLYKYTVFDKIYFAEFLREAKCDIPPDSSIMVYLSSFVLDNDLFP